MKRITLLSVVIAGFFMVNAARAQFQVLLLDGIASAFADRPVKVYCRSASEDSAMLFAWGYVQEPINKAKFTVVDEMVCFGALSIDNDSDLVGDYYKAIGVIVLTHEAFHLRRIPGNSSEAITECRAFRHYDYAITMLGGEEEILNRLMPKAIKLHFYHNRIHPQYDRKSCKTPDRYAKWLS